MEILTAAEMAVVDRRTAEEFGVPVATLMENAGAAVARFCLRRYGAAKRVVALCGKGNNGGDGLVAARLLARAGLEVSVLLLGRPGEVKGEAAGVLAELREGAPVVAVMEPLDEAGLAGVMETLGAADLILDAVVGTGFKPPLRGMAAMLQGILERIKTPVVAVDLPSGWDADSVEQEAEGAFRADAVVTFTAPKMAHVFGHLTDATFGPVVVAEIGSPREVVEGVSGLRWAGSSKGIAEAARGVNANKGKFGHVLVVGGSYGTAGAPGMASLAALRAGAGLVTAAVPASIVDTVAGVTPELMVIPLRESGRAGALEKADVGYGTISVTNWKKERMERALKGIKVVAVGPGMSTNGETPEFVRSFVTDCKLPMVIDADALNAFAGRDDLLKGDGRVMVLTPHPGEMARLVGMTVAEVEKDRVGLARRFAMAHKVTLVLKGWRTLVAHPDGQVAVNTSGNPAMAKGGSGDILTGICAAMLAQFPADVAGAVEAAVCLHGLAGDFAARAMDEHTVLATDTVGHLSDAFRYRVEDGDGLIWICGVNEGQRRTA
jgi:ADP-dependent NAD(P)H-hydrate dehydratase / NAD(P)H-hydrate epimerase